jgi:uncharacterized protein (TIGR00730 family)
MNHKLFCVYCGASPGLHPSYSHLAEHVGRTLVSHGYGLVYGGGAQGLMGIVAKSVLEAGGYACGIITDFLKDKEGILPGLQELYITSSMHERKMMMFQKATGFIVLPGGSGTLDEFFEILVWSQLGLHQHPIVLMNENKYWDPLISLIHHMIKEGFLNKIVTDMIYIVDQKENLSHFLSPPVVYTDHSL